MNTKNLFISNLGWKHKEYIKIINLLRIYNIRGIDFAPLQISSNWKDIIIKSRKFRDKLKNLKIKVNAIQGVFYGTKFNLFDTKKSNHDKIYNHLKNIIKIAKLFNSKKIIIGSSKFRNIKKLSK